MKILVTRTAFGKRATPMTDDQIDKMLSEGRCVKSGRVFVEVEASPVYETKVMTPRRGRARKEQ